VFPFKRILDFDKAQVAQMEQRLNTRYTPGASFPLQAWLLTPDRLEWPAKILNISGNGIGLLVEPVAQTTEGQAVRVRLRFGAHQQLVDGKIVHRRVESGGVACGIGLHFPDFLARKTYLQLLQPIAIGQSLKPVPDDRVEQNEPQFIKRVYSGDEESGLTVWLDKTPGTPFHSFEFRMNKYFCHVDGKSGVLEAYQREETDSHKGKLSNPVFDISGSLHAEIRQLFRWILPNLSSAVPEDVRAFLQRFAN
jgi:hypothetical protein